MAPGSEYTHWLSHPQAGEEIVISGIAGAFPECDSVKELETKLFNKEDLVTDEPSRWNTTNPSYPRWSGKIKTLNKFDAEFFGVDFKLAHTMDPMARIMLEKAYEALLDAGVNPEEIRNTRTGVFSGSCVSESEMYWQYDRMHVNQNGVLGCARSMFANRISQWLGLSGPSFSVDTGCASTCNALDGAFKAIREGVCDDALVVGANLCIHPVLNQKFVTVKMLSREGRCRCFDESGSGYVRSDAVVACFVQKAKNARRAYVQVVNVKSFCDGYKKEGIMYPHVEMQKSLLREFYRDSSYSPADIEFFEAHSTGTRAGDTLELEAIDEVFCRNRDKPLLIGSTKSNMGHVEAVSALTSLAKISIAYYTGYIPPNLHYNTPREGCPALKNGNVKVVVDKQPWDRGLSAMNNFGFGGVISHLLLKNASRPKINYGLPSDELPRLVLASGRTSSAVSKIFKDLASRNLDVEEIGLLHEFFARDIPKHPYRGFAILGCSGTKTNLLADSTETFKGSRPPLTLIYPGIFSYWPGMASQMLTLPIFAQTYRRCAKVLAGDDIDLVKVIVEADTSDARLSILATVAFQISITELLKSIGITPDHITGPDVSKFACAYLNGTWTLNETMIAAHHFTKRLNIGNGLDEKTLLDLDIKGLLNDDSKLWIENNTYGMETTNTDFYNGVLEKLNSGDVVLSLTDQIQKKFLDGCSEKNVKFIPLVQKNLEDQVVISLLSGFGKLYEAGINMRISEIYPPVQFPVSQGTPRLSHLAEWDHSEEWYVMKFNQRKLYSTHRTIAISLYEDDFEYLLGHVIDGSNIYPLSCLLFHVWETLGMCMGRLVSELPVVFTNVCSLETIEIPSNGKIDIDISLHKDSGDFEIIANDKILVTGTIEAQSNVSKGYNALPSPVNDDDKQKIRLQGNEFYKELRIRGYQYIDKFRAIENCSINGNHANITWDNCWVTFIDAMMQLSYFNINTRNIFVPSRIERLSINPDLHFEEIAKHQVLDVVLDAFVYPYVGVVRSGGIELRGLSTKLVKRKPYLPIVQERCLFVPYFDTTNTYTIDEILRMHLQTILENTQTFKVKCVELVDEYEENGLQSIKDSICTIVDNWLLFEHNVIVVPDMAKGNLQKEANAIAFIGADLLKRQDILESGIKTLREAGCIISREKTYPTIKEACNFEVTSVFSTGQEYFVLLRRKTEAKTTTYCKIATMDLEFSWIEEVRNAMKEYQRVVLYNQGEEDNGLLGLAHTFRKEPGCEKICGLLIADAKATDFDPDLAIYKVQMNKNLAFNVFKNGQWGAYRHLSLDAPRSVPVTHGYVNVSPDGKLCTLQWVEGPLSANCCEDKKTLVHVYSSGVCHRDLQIAEGNLSAMDVKPDTYAQDCFIGMEIAGRTSDGSRVMGLVPRYGITNLAYVDNQFLWSIPGKWSMKDAATVPVAYLTAYSALVLEAKVRPEESIFVYDGGSDVSQAVINVALSYKCKVFTTANTEEKKKFIEKTFGVTAILIRNEEDTSFERIVRHETKCKGVNIVLGYRLLGERLQASIRCVSNQGRFVQIGNLRISDNTHIPTECLNEGISFHRVILENIFDKGDHFKEKLVNLCLNGIKSGVVRPIIYTAFDKEKMNTAFRYLADDRHFGKVIITVRDEENKLDAKPELQGVEAIPSYICKEDHVHILVGGLGGFGLEWAQWLVERGARKLVLVSSRGVTTGYQAMKLRKFAAYGAEVHISTDDVTTYDGCKRMLVKAILMGTVAAIYNMAVVLKDATFPHQTIETFRDSFGPKALATIHLDKLSRKLCPELKSFVGFSSLVTSGRGNAGQTNYGLSNSVIERVCEHRRHAGLPGMAVQWGPLSEVGLLAGMEDNNVHLNVGGCAPQCILSCLDTMHMYLGQDEPVVSSVIIGEKDTDSGSSNAFDAVAQLLGIKNLMAIPSSTTIGDLGVDSVSSREIHEFLERKFEKFLTSEELTVLSLSKLMELISEGDSSSD